MNLIAKLPSAEQVRQICGYHNAGWKTPAIAERVFGKGNGWDRTLTSLVRNNPERFDTYVDEVAVGRCLEGEQGLWEGMTYRERLEVLRRALARREYEFAKNREWTPIVKELGGVFFIKAGEELSLYPYPEREAGWLLKLCEATGFASPTKLLDQARLMQKRARGRE